MTGEPTSGAAVTGCSWVRQTASDSDSCSRARWTSRGPGVPVKQGLALVHVADSLSGSTLWIMANYIRTIVSGGKARFKDKELDVDLGAPYP
jgi:hypothetical protein